MSLEESIANAIFEDATSKDAGRVVFWDGEALIPVEIDSEAIYRTLLKTSPVKVKLQKRTDTRWVDSQNYQRIDRILSSSKDWLKPLRAGQIDNLDDVDFADLAVWAQTSKNRFHHSLKHLVRSAMPETSPKGYLVARKSYPVLLKLADQIDDPHLRYAIAQMQVISGLCSDNDPRLIPGQLEDYLDNIRFAPLGPESETVRLLWKGKITSLHSRGAATAIFKKAQLSDIPSLIHSFYFDMGVHSYFASEDLEKVAPNELPPFIKLHGQQREGIQAVNCSVDPNFLRIYGARFLMLAQQVPEVDFILTLCCDQEEAIILAEELLELATVLCDFNRSGAINNLIINSIAVPEWVKNPVTFYASARFFAAKNLLSTYERLYTMDIDLEATDHPGAYWASLPPSAVLAPHSRNFVRLSPWRRVLAGNVQMSQKALESGILDQICSYLSLGLTYEPSWMLDQNALAFAQEIYPDDFADIGSRPFKAYGFKQSWEERYKNHNEKA